MIDNNRFTDTISRNTDVRTAIEKFDQRKPMQLGNYEMLPSMAHLRSKLASSKSQDNGIGYSVKEYGVKDQDAPAPVPRPRTASHKSADGHRSPSFKEPRPQLVMHSSQDVLYAAPSANYLIDDEIVEPRRFVDRPYLPANYGKGIVGLYQSSVFNDLRINQALETDKMPTIALKSPDIISGRKSNASDYSTPFSISSPESRTRASSVEEYEPPPPRNMKSPPPLDPKQSLFSVSHFVRVLRI
ncbi:hypothetical protein WR25_04142 [Diploscapter pachys]|uniref:Uncharacterized protein n=1 Tax=Diploscapter pachys TaxID=2018661 RepID=A0A2A2JV74_9BILA|nr:hypothetical protein WR25_04142 [Diploscapter pachys]